jgi:hypothetical protein
MQLRSNVRHQTAVMIAVLCMIVGSTTFGQNAPTFYDRATDTVRQIFDDPLRRLTREHVQQKWSQWSKCVAEGADRMSRLFDCSPGVVKSVEDYQNRVRVIGQMMDDRILTRDDGLKGIAAEHDRLWERLTPLIQDRVYREAAGMK